MWAWLSDNWTTILLLMVALACPLMASAAVPGEAIQVVIGPDRLEPRVLHATTADRVTFVNCSGRVVQVEFGPDREGVCREP